MSANRLIHFAKLTLKGDSFDGEGNKSPAEQTGIDKVSSNNVGMEPDLFDAFSCEGSRSFVIVPKLTQLPVLFKLQLQNVHG